MESYIELAKQYENLDKKDIKKNEQELEKERQLLDRCENDVLEYYKQHGHLERKLEDTKEKQSDLEQTRKEYEAYDLLLKCLHSNGIPSDIIRRSLPVLNGEIAKILTNLSNFLGTYSA
jgi:DNA repair exonuclease SbcCD ATPase subunit